MGTFGSAEFSQITKSTGHFETPCFHWPPMIGVLTMLGTVTPANLAGFDQSRLPTGVSTLSVLMAETTFDLSFGFPLAFKTAAATSNRERLAPGCCFHCLPVADSSPSPSCLLVTPVSDDLYVHV